MRRQRREQEGEHRQRQHEQHQRQRVVAGPCRSASTPEAGVEPGLRLQAARAARGTPATARTVTTMRLTMCLSLKWPSSCASTASISLRRQARQQGVEEDDALGRAEAGEIGVAVRAALAAVHHEQALGGEAARAASGCRCAPSASSSSSGLNLLNSGAITVGYSTSISSWKPIHTSQAYSHHRSPALLHQRQHHPQQRQADGGAQQQRP